ncbi:MAG: murein biosynthesis integral membrane protein MurJ [Candidatus Promineifilaceae bacterium]|nr:murein biosynthesis integral membrane protein MurJ [Candidatus Promineifilaceae bacterium]
MIRARHLFKSSIIVILLFGLGKITGLLRIRLVSTAFGAGAAYDAYTAANQLPEVFFTIIAGGSLAAAFIPVYSDYLNNKSTKESARLANTILTLVIAILGFISLVGAVFAPWLTRHVLVPGFSPEMQSLTAEIMRVILLQTTLFGISGVISSILNTHQHFAVPAMASISLDLGYIMGLFLFAPRIGIVGLAWGTVLGALIQIFIQVPVLRHFHFRYWPVLAVKMRGVREIILLMIPRIFTLGAIQIADLFIIRLASGMVVGSTSAYFYAYSLMQFPETLFATAIALVVFPTMSELYNAGDIDGLRHIAGQTLSIIWFLTIPAAVGMVLLGRPLIALLLQGGAFTASSADLVYVILVVFSVRIVTEATVEVVARLFYAQHNTWIPMLSYTGWLVVNVLIAYLLVEELGIVALALASTVAFTLLAIVLFYLNSRSLGGLESRALTISLVRGVLAATGMAIVILLISQLIKSPIMLLVAGGAAGAATYFILSYLLGGKEIQHLVQLMRAR